MNARRGQLAGHSEGHRSSAAGNVYGDGIAPCPESLDRLLRHQLAREARSEDTASHRQVHSEKLAGAAYQGDRLTAFATLHHRIEPPPDTWFDLPPQVL